MTTKNTKNNTKKSEMSYFAWKSQWESKMFGKKKKTNADKLYDRIMNEVIKRSYTP